MNPDGTISASFLAFVAWLGVVLTPAQSILCAVAFDGAEPAQLGPKGRAIARQLFGDVETIPAEARRVVVAVCGGWSGKSWLLIALRAVHLALTVDTSHLGAGDTARATIVAPDTELGEQTFGFVLGCLASRHELEARIVGKPATAWVDVSGVGNRPVRIQYLAATVGGKAARGKRHVYFAMDEAAFFRDKNYAVNDKALFKAAKIRIVKGGQLIVSSTPWAEEGVLYELHTKNHGHPVDALSAHAPTLLMREGDAQIASDVAAEYADDPENAAREYGAEFLPTGSSAFFDPRAIKGAVLATIMLPRPIAPGITVSAGGDFAFEKDSSAAVVVHGQGGTLTVADLLEQRPAKDAILKPSVVVAEIAKMLRRHNHDRIVADGHSRAAIVEHCEREKITFVRRVEGINAKADQFQLLRQLLHEGRVKLPDHPGLLRQLRETTSVPRSGGGVSIRHPASRSGVGGASTGHGDLADALVLAVYAQKSSTEIPREEPAWDAKSWVEKLREAQGKQGDALQEARNRAAAQMRRRRELGDEYDDAAPLDDE